MQKFEGSGPGPQTDDGCSVELYRRLPYRGELDEVLPLLAAGASVLELGCGTGRLAAHLAARGHRVVGVDDSAAMLSHLPANVTGVHSSIETLALAQRFDVVLLASHLINHPDAVLRAAFVGCAARHLAPGGVFYLKRHDPAWLRQVQPGPIAARQDVSYAADEVVRDGDRLQMTLVYEAFGERWTHRFETESLEEAPIEALLTRHGLVAVKWLEPQRLWAAARRLPLS